MTWVSQSRKKHSRRKLPNAMWQQLSEDDSLVNGE